MTGTKTHKNSKNGWQSKLDRSELTHADMEFIIKKQKRLLTELENEIKVLKAQLKRKPKPKKIYLFSDKLIPQIKFI